MNNHPVDHRDPADAAIDRAIRDIMSAEPRPGFKNRVLMRLAQEPPAPLWTRPRLGLAAAAVALALMLAIWMRPSEPVPAPTPVATIPQPTISAPPTVPTRVTEPPPVLKRDGDPVRVPGRDREPRLVQAASILFEDTREDAMQIEALTPVAAVAVDALVQPAAALPEIVLENISIKPITIPPIPAGDK